ncbi:MAG TPA: iron-sulfur cluster-binding protein [Phycisphaerales bacterium]|nr:iron-sulfur cluster-binding protein [Phycisphaerales bacterium]HCD32978.1 iron-sulfur cluster-binding protein [Phycisphaerales bacterium]
MSMISRYTHWLHTKWPAGKVEKMPVVNDDGSTNVPGVYVVGDLTGVPLLKFSADTGTRAVITITNDPTFAKRDVSDNEVLDLVIIGGGVSGYAAAMQAQKHGLKFQLLEAAQPFATIENFPKAKPIYTYPTDMTPAGDLQFHEKSDIKEGLLADLHEQADAAGIKPTTGRAESVKRVGKLIHIPVNDQTLKAHRVIIAIGRSGNYRKLNVPGEELSHKVTNRLHDPKAYANQNVLVVGGGDSALEAAIALAQNNADVTLSYRKPEFSRPKPENVEKLDSLQQENKLKLMMASNVKTITENDVTLIDKDKQDVTIANDAVITLIGREAPLDFFRKSGIHINGDRNSKWWVSLICVLALFTFIYHWKKPGVWLPIGDWFRDNQWFPYQVPQWMTRLSDVFANPAHLLGTLNNSLASPGFYYSLLYCVIMLIFGIRRIKRRKTPYVTAQTWTLIAVQWLPLFILPYILLPWMGNNGMFDSGVFGWLADQLFPRVDWDPNGRAYYHAFGFILAWPLFVWNVFTSEPMWLWLAISLIQTFVIIPFIVYRWGKGAYCGWICSCGGMAETLGDTQRHKMPHGPFWNKLNLIGQGFLFICIFLLVTRIFSWVWPDSFMGSVYNAVLKGIPVFNYAWFIDLLFAGIIGFGLYFHFSGRVWCRFACPLAALMHIYARFSQFRILAEKSKCISCNVCTCVCHQGIDIMNFANKGNAMEDPECVRCSACVQSCPTGVLTFGRVNKHGNVIAKDKLMASRVQMAELTIGGKNI